MKQFIKKLFNKAFCLAGFSLRRNKKSIQDRRENLEEVLHHLLKFKFNPKTVIDVGVATGTFELYKAYPESKHLLVEPLSEFEGSLIEITKKYRAIYVLGAAGEKNGFININVHKDLLGSSIYKEAEGRYVDGYTKKVRLLKIDDICKEKKLNGPYLLKIDTQGSEILVLKGARRVLRDTDAVILEAHFYQFFKKGPQFYDIISFMKRSDFVVYDIFGGYNRPLDGALASVDLVFVKNHGIYRQNHLFANKDQRKGLIDEVRRNVLNYKDD